MKSDQLGKKYTAMNENDYVGKHEGSIKPEWNYSEFPGSYYYFCGSCGNGIKKMELRCPYCKKKQKWEGIP